LKIIFFLPNEMIFSRQGVNRLFEMKPMELRLLVVVSKIVDL
jgi:hypothetical protein